MRDIKRSIPGTVVFASLLVSIALVMTDTLLTVWYRFHKLPLLEMIPILVSLFVAVAFVVCIFVPLRHPAPRILVGFLFLIQAGWTAYQIYLENTRFKAFFASKILYVLLYLMAAIAMSFPFDSRLAEFTPFYMAVIDDDSPV